MGFDIFIGNERIVSALRSMLRCDRVPSALLFTGPRGIGKFTLARMFAQASNCERLKDDFCGECDSCVRIARLADLNPLIERGLAERAAGRGEPELFDFPAGAGPQTLMDGVVLAVYR